MFAVVLSFPETMVVTVHHRVNPFKVVGDDAERDEEDEEAPTQQTVPLLAASPSFATTTTTSNHRERAPARPACLVHRGRPRHQRQRRRPCRRPRSSARRLVSSRARDASLDLRLCGESARLKERRCYQTLKITCHMEMPQSLLTHARAAKTLA